MKKILNNYRNSNFFEINTIFFVLLILCIVGLWDVENYGIKQLLFEHNGTCKLSHIRYNVANALRIIASVHALFLISISFFFLYDFIKELFS